MSGIRFAGRAFGPATPSKWSGLLANSLAATGTPNTALFPGDIVARTTVSALTSGGVPVVRRLLVADRTASYLESAVAVGVLGIVGDALTTNASGQVNGAPPLAGGAGGPIFSVPSEAASIPPDPATLRSRISVILALPDVYFVGRINVNTTDFASGLTLGHQYDGLLAGLCFTTDTNNNDTIFTLRPAAATALAIIEIIRPNEQDPRYNTLILGTDTFSNNALADSRSGPEVIFRFLTAYSQQRNGVVYSTQ